MGTGNDLFANCYVWCSSENSAGANVVYNPPTVGLGPIGPTGSGGTMAHLSIQPF